MELLAPGGDLDSIKAAILAGADAVYCGVEIFNARYRAYNLSLNELPGVIALAHNHHCKLFLTLNILFVESEITTLVRMLNRLLNMDIDGIIVQDPGLFYLLSRYFRGLSVHASTQCTIHNEGQLAFYHQLGVARVNLARELNLPEIAAMTAAAHTMETETEVFVHGSFCIGFSGICYMSSFLSGNSGNRGRCSQPCRDRYAVTPMGNEYPLNLKDNSAFFDTQALWASGVDALKIEGRIKKPHYVHAVVRSWRQQLDRLYSGQPLSVDNSDLYMVFNRDFTNSYLKGEPGKAMFIDNPVDNSVKHFSDRSGAATDAERDLFELELYDKKAAAVEKVASLIDSFESQRTPLRISALGAPGEPLRVTVSTPDTLFSAVSESALVQAATHGLGEKILLKSLKSLNNNTYFVEDLDTSGLPQGLYLPSTDLTGIKNRLHGLLNGSREPIPPVVIPTPEPMADAVTPSLGVVISSPGLLPLEASGDVALYYRLPESMDRSQGELTEMFLDHRSVTPWFPSILVGESYAAAVSLLKAVRPASIMTDNSGIAHAASELGIPWQAGPGMNITNSWSALCLKERFNCHGAILSGELSASQLASITGPRDFELGYFIYSPTVLFTSRQCLLMPVTGCSKEVVDAECLPNCAAHATMDNTRGDSFVIHKKPGFHHRIYSDTHTLNCDIVTELPGKFTRFFIDLDELSAITLTMDETAETIALFQQLLAVDPRAAAALKERLSPTTNQQYKKGV
ncbi:U32 family peptidase [Myxococcota bacterium]|nr:U32 family peptidase [Myxococcota bacterium]MBU1534916.1 U32 family peptidase [Myxococcota bacterium]